MELEGKIALVTGAGGGIGQAVTEKLAAGGALIALADMSHDLAAELAQRIEGAGGCAVALAGNLTDAAYCDGLVGETVSALGGLDILVNNAGLMRRGAVTEASDEDFALSMAVNVEAPFRLARAAIPVMAERGGGAIVNTASCWGVYPGPNHLVYCTSKAAIAAMTRCLGRDHAHQNIRVNAVCPNEVNTPMLRTGFAIRGLDPDSAVAELNATVPLGRIAEPQDIADVVVFLASDQARYMCGALVEVNGGKPVF
ncbi:MAG: SDR family oxidoreductase [Cohaesibacter sp.]|jgi:NAD(P)-dependent dehydrogenase (short-subunit alcohol dehydrogenase family)|nr:SDR family oxidoreductase [Cohaesibacter sp.]